MARKQSPSTLLWFIRRKAYVPLCEIRRRFELDGDEGIFLDCDARGRIFVGLPAHTASAVEKLWRQGKIGLEMSVEFDCQVLIGVYPMLPVREAHLVIPSKNGTRPTVTVVEHGGEDEEDFQDEMQDHSDMGDYEGDSPAALAAGQ